MRKIILLTFLLTCSNVYAGEITKINDLSLDNITGISTNLNKETDSCFLRVLRNLKHAKTQWFVEVISDNKVKFFNDNSHILCIGKVVEQG